MTIKEIVREYLEGHGFDGLAGDECGCGNGDLWPCDYSGADCRPAYLWVCPEAKGDCSEGSGDCPAVFEEEGCEWFPDGCYRTERQP